MQENAPSPVAFATTPSELLRLPPEERDIILEAAAILAESIYRDNPDLTDFEAFEVEDRHGEVAETPKG